MKKTLISLVSLLSLATLCSAQTLMTSTTLSAALDAKTKTVVVASATGIGAYPNLQTAQGGIGSPATATLTILYVDREALQVMSFSGTTLQVKRGFLGTRETTHLSGAKVWVGLNSQFPTVDQQGSCSRTASLTVPYINPLTGNYFDCAVLPGQTVLGNWVSFTSGSPAVGLALASASTIAPVAPITHVTGTTNVVNITVPAACPLNACQLTLVPDGTWATTNAGNIAIASTGVVSKALIMTYDPNTSKWYPSY